MVMAINELVACLSEKSSKMHIESLNFVIEFPYEPWN